MKLYVVATPIGHLEDITYRAVKILKSVDSIIAEDTRHTQKLLAHYQISTPLLSLHQHNEVAQTPRLVQRLLNGETMALVSDAGTPLIHDPGHYFVKHVHEARIPVLAIPGPCAAIAALSIAGLPTQPFEYVGFLPAKSHQRQVYLENLRDFPHTLVFYEAPHRILDSIMDMCTVFGENRFACLAKELTKQYETLQRGTLKELANWLLQDTAHQKGEFVVLVSGYTRESAQSLSKEHRLMLQSLLEELSTPQAVKVMHKITGIPRNELYQHALDARHTL